MEFPLLRDEAKISEIVHALGGYMPSEVLPKTDVSVPDEDELANDISDSLVYAYNRIYSGLGCSEKERDMIALSILFKSRGFE